MRTHHHRGHAHDRDDKRSSGRSLRVHDLHVRTLSSNVYSLSAHVRLRDMRDWPQVLARCARGSGSST
jgi:Co/Zn/Cd efflux system component